MAKIGKKTVLIFIGVLTAVAFAFASFSDTGNYLTEPDISAGSIKVTKQDVRSVQIFQGQLDYVQKIEARSLVSANLIESHINIGDRVLENELLLQFDPTEIHNQIARIEAKRTQLLYWLKNNYPAQKTLLEAQRKKMNQQLEIDENSSRAALAALIKAQGQDIATKDDVSEARRQLSLTLDQAKIERAKQDISKAELESEMLSKKATISELSRENSKYQNSLINYSVTSPFPGVVTALTYRISTGLPQAVSSGDFLLAVTNMDRMILEITLPQSELFRFAKTSDYTCIISRYNMEIPCKLISISQKDRSLQKEEYLARFALEEKKPALTPGDGGEVNISHIVKKDVIAIPITYLTKKGADTGVMSRHQGETIFSVVELGVFGNDLVEVLAGLQVGQEIIAP